MKVCAKCGEAKGFDLFYRDTQKRDGLSSRCKPCLNADPGF